jgi:hypothetical protein
MSETEQNLTEWCDGFELVLKKEAEQSESLFWLHNKASQLATSRNDMIQIPSIILQTLTGFLSATNGLVNPLILGGVSVFTGILSTMLSYFKFSARAEGHRVVAQLYMKIFKKIEVELALPIKQRETPQKLLDEVREKLARINEVAPDVPENIIAQYKKQFKDNGTSHPVIANGLDIIHVYKEPVGITTPRSPEIRIHVPVTGVPPGR